ncbi:hypothetical protein DNTS_009168 [Danionella cerebrum]|uniref:Sushi domain-containing protein n=1 Tax=Danionella cerebrum TaxID=2873325 RepID=A0A553QAX1_9TELE|nr:hypothetical protein DNTS_009168 [Danionella translucida]
MRNRMGLFGTVPFLLLIFEHVHAQCSLPSFEANNVVPSEFYPPSHSFPEGFVLTFECKTGHKATGQGQSKTVTCSNGSWTELALTCTPVKCDPPPAIVNGEFVDAPLEVYEYSQVVTYKCNKGFSLSGKASIHCSEDGTFKPEPPKCVDGCVKPVIPNAYRISGKASPPYTIGSFIEYGCSPDYVLEGASQITCKGERWDPEPPMCIEPCNKPDFGANFILTQEFQSKSKFPHKSKATLECSRGYVSVDPAVIRSDVTCDRTTWTPLKLTCKEDPKNTTETSNALVLACLGKFGYNKWATKK